MTDNRDFDRAVAHWLDDGSDATPPEIINAVLLAARSTPQERDVRISWRTSPMKHLAYAVAAVAILAVGVTALSALSPRFGILSGPTPIVAPITGSLPAEQTAVIARHAAALNSRDVEAFVDLFAVGAGIDPRGTFAASSSLFANTLPVADRSLLGPFMAINEAWGFEVEVVSCDRLSRAEYAGRYTVHSDDVDVFAHCAVKSRWARLSLEIGEWWNYELSGTDILWWSQKVRDASPADRVLPLGLDGLLEWEGWLESADRDAAARLLNPRVFYVPVPCGPPSDPPCVESSDGVDVERITTFDNYGGGQEDWIVAGQRFAPDPLIPHDPALAAEIEASIQEYLEEIQS